MAALTAAIAFFRDASFMGNASFMAEALRNPKVCFWPKGDAGEAERQ